MQIQLRCRCGAGDCPEWAIVELQGVVEAHPSVRNELRNLEIGRLCRTSEVGLAAESMAPSSNEFPLRIFCRAHLIGSCAVAPLSGPPGKLHLHGRLPRTVGDESAAEEATTGAAEEEGRSAGWSREAKDGSGSHRGHPSSDSVQEQAQSPHLQYERILFTMRLAQMLLIYAFL